MSNCQWCGDSFGHRPECPALEVSILRARVAELEAERDRLRFFLGDLRRDAEDPDTDFSRESVAASIRAWNL